MRIEPFVVAVGTLAVMVFLDYIWLGVLARRYYRKTLSRVIAFEVRWLPAFAFYLLHTLGLLWFVILPGAADPDAGIGRILLQGASFGLFTYGTYDLTNMATIRNWPLSLTIVDILWGMLVSALSAAIGLGIMHLLGSA